MKTLFISIAMVVIAIIAFGQQKASTATQSTKPQSTQSSAKMEPAQAQKTAPQEKTSTANKESNTDVNNKGHKKGQSVTSAKSNDKETQSPLWKCSKCDRVFTSPPANGVCPYDGTAVGRIK